MSGRFVKGQSGNPSGRPKARRPNISAFDIIFDKTLTATQNGVARELTVDEALQLQTYQDALKGNKMAVRAVLKMIEKRETAIAKLARAHPPSVAYQFEHDADNANEAMFLLGIAEDYLPAGLPHGHRRPMFKTWATQAALSRPGRRALSERDIESIKRDTIDPEKAQVARRDASLSQRSDADQEPVGYKQPPRSYRFEKGTSGNPRGRLRNRRRELPYDQILGQMVTVRENGRERRVTAAEAFLLQLTRKGLHGDSAAARASLAAIETARASRHQALEDITIFRILWRSQGVGCSLKCLGMAVKRYPLDEKRVRFELKPWIVEAALRRMPGKRLTEEQQRVVVDATHHPEKVEWPEWWSVRS